MRFELDPFTIQELGKRDNQEDSLFPAYGQSTYNDRLFILCDGMGGHDGGEVASSAVCEAMSQVILSRWNPNEPLSDDLLNDALNAAYDALDERDSGAAKKMGTTMTFLCLHAKGATVAHIGDSRVYQLRPARGNEPASIVFCTRDHSLVNDLVRVGEITEEEAKTHPQRNVITRAMQPNQERRAKADIAHLTDIQPGDYFYMCSDGMLEQTTDDNLRFIITKNDFSDDEKKATLLDVTKDNKDNHTAHLIHIVNVEGAYREAVTAPVGVAVPEIVELEPAPMPEHTQRPAQQSRPNVNVQNAALQNRNKLYLTIIAILAIAVIALAASFFLKSSPKEGEDVKTNPAPQTETRQTTQEEPSGVPVGVPSASEPNVAPQNQAPSQKAPTRPANTNQPKPAAPAANQPAPKNTDTLTQGEAPTQEGAETDKAESAQGANDINLGDLMKAKAAEEKTEPSTEEKKQEVKESDTKPAEGSEKK